MVGCSGIKLITKSNSDTYSQDFNLMSTIWMQNSSEYIALTYQAFNIAKFRLDQKLKNINNPRPLAIIVDVDETILSNAPYQARNVLKNRSFSEDEWFRWTSQSSAEAIAGAVDFLKYAYSKNIDIFYITNRHYKELDFTITNLKRLGLPVNKKFIYPQRDNPSKKIRRDSVLATHEILLLIGDSMADFHEIFDNLSLEQAKRYTGKLKDEFGDRFIILPNPMYGAWLPIIYKNSNATNSHSRHDALLNHLYPMKE